MPSGRRFPLAFGTYTRRTGTGFQEEIVWWTQTAISARVFDDSATCPSIPAVLRPALRCVTWRTLTSVFDQDRSNTGRPVARCLSCARSFSTGPRSEPRGPVSEHVALQRLCRDGGEVARVDGLVAGGADNQRLPAHVGHELCPRGLWASRSGEVGEFADLMNLHVLVSLTPFTPARLEPGDQFLAGGGRDCRAVVEDRFLLSFQRDATEPGDQWFPACPFDDGLEARALPVGGVDFGLILAGHRRHPGAVLGGQGLEHRGFGGPFQPVQPPNVSGQ